jgi:hypothetical protein
VKKLLMGFVSIIILAIPWTGQAQDPSKQDQVKQWVQTLAEQDSRFIPFSQASIEFKLFDDQKEQILFKDHEKTIGYMVAAEQNQQLSLLEYGLGPHPLFDQKMVNPYLLDPSESLQMVYAGLESAWTSADGLYDGKSGEKYPQAALLDEIQPKPALSAASSLTASIHSHSISPFPKAWFKNGTALNHQEELLENIAQNQVTYVAKLFHQTVTAPYSVLGCHVWNHDDLYIELADDGSRFVPYSHLVSLGHFLR